MQLSLDSALEFGVDNSSVNQYLLTHSSSGTYISSVYCDTEIVIAILKSLNPTSAQSQRRFVNVNAGFEYEIYIKGKQ